MLQIYPVETNEDIEVAKELFTEFDDFLKEQLREYESFPWMTKHWLNCKEEVDGLAGKYLKPRCCILIAEYNSQAVGCVGLLEENGEVGMMKRLYVKEEFRGLGIGKGLVKTIVEYARNKNYKVMRILTNLYLKAAINLYKSRGFEKVNHD